MFFRYLITICFFCHAYADKPGFFMDAAALYWRAQEGGLNYAVNDERLLGPDFDWDVGFKVGFGYRMPHDRWDLLLELASLQTHTDSQNSGGVYLPVWLTVPGFADEAKMHWRLHLALLDLVLSKNVEVSKSLTLSPELGIRYGSARQKFNLDYLGGSFSSTGESVRMKNKFWGIGPRIGLAGAWAMGKGFSLFSEGAYSLLFGEFYLHQDESSATERTVGLHSVYHQSASILDGAAGLRWQRRFSGALKELAVELAWDQLLLFSQNQLVRLVSEDELGLGVANQGDLSIAGVQLNFRLDF